MLTWCRLINWNKVTLIVQRAIKYANESRILLLQYYPFTYYKKLEQLLFLITSLINIVNLFTIRNLLFFFYDNDLLLIINIIVLL